MPAILALGTYFLWRPNRNILAALSIASIVAVGLAPFHFSSTTQAFSWVPFRALFTTDWQTGFAIFFRKSFSYGSVIWLLGGGLSSALYFAALLATLEGIQLWLPNHAAESTDPLHALLMAWVLKISNRGTQSPANASVRL